MTVKHFAIAISACVALTVFAGDAARRPGPSPQELVKRQARSVHLFYTGTYRTDITAAAATVTVRKSYPGSYFAVLVWNGGYCGIQELPKGDHILIFSVWDPVSPYDMAAKADSVKEELRAKIVYADPSVAVSRFEGEGSGAKTMAKFDWRENCPVRFKVESEEDGEDRTMFTCYVKDLETMTDWRKVASISTVRRPGVAKGLVTIYSFVEDFMRNGASARNGRLAEFSDIEILGKDGWQPITAGWFSGDDTPSTNVSAGKIAGTDTFYLATGGDTANGSAKLFSWIQ